MYQITLATSNKHKVDEINLIAKDFDIEFVLPDGDFNPVEDSDNFIGNAYCKAKSAALNAKTKLTLADDSGLCVEALDNAPVYIVQDMRQLQKKELKNCFSI